MRRVLQSLLISTLLVSGWGCRGSEIGPNESVSANSEEARQNASNTQSNKEYAPTAPSRTEGAAPRPAPRRETPAATAQPDDRFTSNSNGSNSNDRLESESQTAPKSQPRGMETVPQGTEITVALLDPLSTETSQEGDKFQATLAEGIVVDGKTIVPRGTTVEGRVDNVVQPGKVKGRAMLELSLTGIKDGTRWVSISTDPFTAVAEDNKDRDAGIIAGGAGVGAIIGGIAGGKKGAAIGAILGGGGGTTAVLATKGQDMRLDPETRVNFVLDKSVRLPIITRPIS